MRKSAIFNGGVDLHNECWCMLADHPDQIANGKCCSIVDGSVKFELVISLCPARFHRLLGLIEFDSEECEVIGVKPPIISNLEVVGTDLVVELSFTVRLNRIYKLVEHLKSEELLQWLKANVPKKFLSPPPPKARKERRAHIFHW